MTAPIYLDYAATTPVAPEVQQVMMDVLASTFGNAASRSHLYGWQAEEVVEVARNQVADLLQADPREIIWTSGATEANQLALRGFAQANGHRGRHIVSSLIEHKSVLDNLAQLQREGFRVTYLPPDDQGLITADQLEAALLPDTILVSLMQGNNELGTVTAIEPIAALCHQRGIALHVDAVQTIGKLDVNVRQLDVDLLSLSAHKFYGPKGVGALYVRRQGDIRLQAQMLGGGHERGLRSGTLATHQIAGLGQAAALAKASLPAEPERLRALQSLFWQRLQQGLGDGVSLNGHPQQRLPSHLNIAFSGIDGECLLMALNQIALSTGSACNSVSMAPSYVLKAIGLDDALALASLRFSFGRFTTEAMLQAAANHVIEQVHALRRQSTPLLQPSQA